MIRALVASPLLLIVAVVAGCWFAYGQIDPCRMLAVERARNSTLPTAVIEDWTQLEGSQMDEGECVSGLFDAWGKRLSDWL
ncbi:MAG TPA: hypothetical protein VHW02_06610 [Rhizomicrobium sp.]|jgi:hypothetical protein|nr:hypothetical protein [Rhizomicrobium sp.]